MNTQTTPEAQQPLTIVEPKATESFVVRKGSIKIAEFPHYLHDEPSKAESKKYAQMLVEAPSMKAQIEELTRQRDELLNALQTCVNWAKNGNQEGLIVFEQAQAAISSLYK